MKKQFIKDLPIYLNGFAVGILFFGSDISVTNVLAYALAMITFIWYGKINKQSGGVIGEHITIDTDTGSNPVLTSQPNNGDTISPLYIFNI